jgi:uncharacterized hydrophobic protein (TIGR00271 family)
MKQDESSKTTAERPRTRDILAHLQDRIAAAFGIQPADREEVVRAMLDRSGRAPAGYWLQLFLAMGIASLGLVLGSTAVVIGAMLISPLMSPIVELGMGLAIGSPFLVLRSAARVAASIAGVVTSAALLTLALPFNEVTSEIASRTSPTALDLLIATFCAIAAAYTSVRPGSDTTSTAAGTAIGIALVPPLCVVGFGIGTGSRPIASGSALLFTANLCAIVLCAVLCFLILGYNTVSTVALERDEIEHHAKGRIRRVVLALQVFFGRGYGRLFRVIMPLVLLGSVYLPLQRALAEVTWQVRVRAAVERMLGDLPQNTVRTRVLAENRVVSVELVAVGRAEDAAKIKADLTEKIAVVAGVVPAVKVIAVPDADALREATAAARASVAEVTVVQKVPDLSLLKERFDGALSRSWPKEAGVLLRWRLELPEGAPGIVEVVHAGSALGEAGAALLGKELSRELEATVSVRSVAVPPGPMEAAPEAGIAWLPGAIRALEAVSAAEVLSGCVEVPVVPVGSPLFKEVTAITAALRASPTFQSSRIHIADGKRWSAVVSTAPCEDPNAASVDAGAPTDAGARDAGDALLRNKGR